MPGDEVHRDRRNQETRPRRRPAKPRVGGPAELTQKEQGGPRKRPSPEISEASTPRGKEQR